MSTTQKELTNNNDKVESPRDGGERAGVKARIEAANEFQPADRSISANASPVSKGAFDMSPGDSTTAKYFGVQDKASEQSASRSSDKNSDKSSDNKQDAGDKGLDKPGDKTLDKAADNYRETLIKSGLSPELAKEFTDKKIESLNKKAADGKLDGTPAEQLARSTESFEKILAGPGSERLENGQHDNLTKADRQNIVKDLAAREADPDKYVNQGQHMTCVLESGQKQKLEGSDPAKVSEQIASVVNKGYAEVQEKDGSTRRVNVDSRSFAPDSESRVPFDTSYHGDAGKRGMAGQVYDALSGQLAADLKSEREGKPSSAQGIDKAANVYMAAHADTMGALPGQTKTGEGLFERQPNGNMQFKADNPMLDVWGMAHLNKAMGGEPGAVFAHRDMLKDGHPPQGYPQDLKITTFGSAQELGQSLASFEAKTGQPAQILVNAPFLPGGGENGHGLHAMNARIDGSGNIKFDNNWGSNYDKGAMSMDQVDKATNPQRWEPKGSQRSETHPDKPDQAPQHRGGNRGSDSLPDEHTLIKPGSGRNPNETESEYAQRQALEKQELDKQNKNKQSNNDNGAQFQRALAEWEMRRATAERSGQSFNDRRPSEADFNVPN